MMLHLLIAIAVTAYFMFLGFLWSESRDLRSVVRRQGDELNKAKSDIMQMQAQLADVSFYLTHGRARLVSRGIEEMKSPTIGELKQAAEHQSRPGERDQELLLR